MNALYGMIVSIHFMTVCQCTTIATVGNVFDL